MKLKTNLVTIDRGVLRKSFGVLLIVAGIILVVAVDGRGALGCLAISVLGAAVASPTDRLKLDFASRRYLRVSGWAPFLRLRGGTFDDLEGISISPMARGSAEGRGGVSRVLFLNWTSDLHPFELAAYEESALYDGTAQPLIVLRKPKGTNLVPGAVAAELRAEEFRERFGFHKVNP